MDLQRVLVIGSPGAGKSTFSRKLRDITGLPLCYLDMMFHNPDRTSVSRAEFDEKLSAVLGSDRWIIDGNYQRTLPARFERCTHVFFFDLPVEQCLQGAASRVGKAREDMPWIETDFDPEFRQYILDFQKDQLPLIYELIDKYKDSAAVTIFRSRKEADDWMDRMIKEMKMTFKTGDGWKACYDEATGIYSAERSGNGYYDLYELTKELFDSLADGMSDADTYKIIDQGRHLYMDVNDRCGPPYTVVFDDDYEKLCPWAKVKSSGRVWPDELTDAAVEIFESEKNNREQRRKRREEKGK